MKNGIAMISKLSMPVKSFIETASIGTAVNVNRKVITVRPSAIETGTPVSISAISSAKMVAARSACGSTRMPAFSPRQIVKISTGARIRMAPSGLTLRAADLVASPAACGCSAGEMSVSTPSTCASSWWGKWPVQ